MKADAVNPAAERRCQQRTLRGEARSDFGALTLGPQSRADQGGPVGRRGHHVARSTVVRRRETDLASAACCGEGMILGRALAVGAVLASCSRHSRL